MRPTVLVTGASTGLGLAIARQLIAAGCYHVILTARQASLSRFAEAGIFETENVWLRPLDVAIPEERRRVVAEADDQRGGIDILINNAGVAYRAVVEHFTEDARLDAMLINFRGPMELIRLVLPKMREKRQGRILNISSVGGMMAMPTMALYSASKFALEGATESLWYEVRPWNIKVSLIEPGFIHSDSFRNTRDTTSSREALTDPANPYHAHYQNMAGMIERMMDLTRTSPDAVARKVLAVLRQKSPPLRVPATWDAHAFSLLRRLLPRGLYHWVLHRMLPNVKVWGR